MAPTIQRSTLTLALVWLLEAQATTGAQASPGDLDPSFAGFGINGKLVLPASAGGAMAMQPDGRIVLLGENSGGRTVWCTRLLADGKRDGSFGYNGTVIFSAAIDLYPNCVAIQPDGKIVFGGYASVFGQVANFMVGRLTTTGAPDPTFDGDGWTTAVFTTAGSLGYALVLQPDGKILVGGTAPVGGDDDFAAARFLSNGALDPSFSGDGKVTFGFGGDDGCHDMVLQSDGRIIMVGGTSGTFDDDFAVGRLLANGTLDSSFDGDGKVSTGLGDSESATAVALQPDGRIVVAGSVGTSDGKFARYLSNGSLDSSFDGDGKLTLTQNDNTRDVVVQPDGKIVVLGTHTSPDNDEKFAFHRLNPNGSLDTTFDGDGDAFVDLGLALERGETLLLQPDGRLLACGFVSGSGMGFVRLCPDGSYDVGGQQTFGFDNAMFQPGSNEDVYGIAAQPDGRVVVVGTVTTALGTESDVALARFLPNGVLDTTFGDNGRVALNVSNVDAGRAVAIQSDGKIVVAGYTGTSDVQFLVARLLSNGSPDASFGIFGFNVLDFAGGPDYAHAISLAPDGKIVLAGSVLWGSQMAFGAARFNANGTVDTSFDEDGRQTATIFGLPTHWASAVMVQPDGKIVVGGHANADFGLVRFNVNGSLDGGFGDGGCVVTDMGGSDAIHALAQDALGGIYAAGGGGPNVDFALAHYYSNGALYACGSTPPCGWQTGKLLVDWGGAETAWAIDIRSDGKVVAAGCVGGQLGWAQVDTGSALNPLKSTTDFAGDIQCEAGGEFPLPGGAGVQYLFSNKLIVAATQNYEGNRNMALASFETTGGIASDAGEDELASTRGVRLEPAFPNPARQACAVSFNLPQSQSARLRVFDVAGRLVRTLADESFAAGRHQRVWDRNDRSGRSVAAGVYYVQLDAGQVHERRSVVVMR